MLTRLSASELIMDIVVKSVRKFASNTLNKKAKFQILDLIIPHERKIRSIVGGLETSLGTTLWEPLAKALASENNFEVINSNLKRPVNMPANLSTITHSIIEDRKTNGGIYDAESSHQEIKRICQSFLDKPIGAFEDPPSGFGVDIWLVKDGVNYFFDTKTVQPNLGTLTKCMEQLLTWYSYYYSMHPDGAAFSRIIFPYNPSPDKSFWEGVIGRGRPLEPDSEGWVENQFWDFCSGLDNTYEIIVTSFEKLRKSEILKQTFNELLNNQE